MKYQKYTVTFLATLFHDLEANFKLTCSLEMEIQTEVKSTLFSKVKYMNCFSLLFNCFY